jgi:ribosomal protein S6
MDIEDKDPKNYELAILVKSEEQLPEIVAFLGQHEATIAGEPRVRKIALAYPVKKETEAVFASYLFSAVPSQAKKLEQDLAVRQDILRSMIIIAIPVEDTRTTSNEGASYAPRRPRPTTRPSEPTSSAPAAPKSAAPAPEHLTNDALEKRIEEILK